MRQRGMSTVAAAGLAVIAGLLTAVALADWVVVDVHVPEEGVHLKVPFPLIAGEIAASFIPEGELDQAVVPPEIRDNREQILAALRALDESPDGVYVRVRAEDAFVLVEKVGSELRVSVDADDARVRCVVPVTGVLDALEGWDWETFEPKLAFDILDAYGHGDLVNMEAEDGVKVAVRMW